MLSRRLGAVAFGASAAIVIAACSQSYAEDAKPVDALPEAGATDSSVTANDADVAVDSAAPPDASPTYIELAKGLTDLAGIAATESDVYVVEQTAGRVLTIPIAGGASTDIETGVGSPFGIAAAGGAVIWTDFGGAKVKSRSLTGGAPTVVSTGVKNPFAVAATNAGVAVLTSGPGLGGELQQYDLGLSPGPTVGPLSEAFAVAAYGSDIYWTEAAAGRVGQGQIGSNMNGDLAVGEADCQSIAANATGVYWMRPAAGLVRVKASASTTATSFVTGEVGPHSIGVDDDGVYWLTSNGTLRRKRIGQELPPATLASGFGSAFTRVRVRALALTSKYAVWITTDGRVLRTDK
jgi:hypothetical protein